MIKTTRSGKQNRHEKITVTLLSGQPVTPDEIRACFAGTDQESVLYRLPTNIYNIRLDGGVVKVYKEGRKVKAYQLMNPQDFNSEGRYQVKKVVVVETTDKFVENIPKILNENELEAA